MKTLFGNSCIKGCLIYLVALVAIVAVTTFGLGGLKGKLNIDGKPQGSILSTDRQPQQPSKASGDVIPTSTRQALPSLPTIVVSLPTQAPNSAGPSITIQLTAAPVQSGSISGEASAPFYIVQSGDTLWEIAQRFGVDVGALGTMNNVVDNIIMPGQLLYLPQTQGQPPAQAGATVIVISPGGVGGDAAQPTAIVPQMPNTGIIKKP